MGISYFQDSGGYLAVTPETPKGPLHGIVYVGRGPTIPGRIDSIQEQAYAKDVLLKLTRVSALDVPDEWIEALGYEKPRPKATPEPAPPAPEPHATEIVIELPGDRVRRMIRAPRGTADYFRVQRKWKLNAVLVAISAAIAWWLVFGYG